MTGEPSRTSVTHLLSTEGQWPNYGATEEDGQPDAIFLDQASTLFVATVAWGDMR